MTECHLEFNQLTLDMASVGAMSDVSATGSSGIQPDLPVELVWGLPGGLGPHWEPVSSTAEIPGLLPPPSEVEALYGAAAVLPPLNEDPKYAALFADVYEVSVRNGQVLASLTRSDGHLRSFAYGHFWSWQEQNYSWAYELNESLGDAAPHLEWTFALNLLARDPDWKSTGIGRRTLEVRLGGVSGYACWLQTDDIDSPARRIYSSLGFVELGHGPQAPNGQPGLMMFPPPVL